jgi:hypothetical protein
MSTISNYILELLNDDMVSHGLLVQCVKQDKGADDGLQFEWKDVLRQLLLSGKVEIGVARSASHDYVEFIAWKGTVGERIARAIECVDSVSGPDQEFAYWLCLNENIDRFAEGENGESKRGCS